MLFSFAIIFLFGLFLGALFNKLKLPDLIGMLIAGIIFGPYGLNLIDNSVLNISSQLRSIALVIILLRAGLTLHIDDLKKIGRPAILLSFLPATFEIIGMLILAPIFLGLNLIESAILATVIAAVSPAVIVPKMIKIKDEKYGTKKKIPQLILAGASVDDIFVIALFSIAVYTAMSGTVSWLSFLSIPVSIISGIILGGVVGKLLSIFFAKIKTRDTVKVLVILSVAFSMMALEDKLKDIINISSLLAVMTSAMTLLFFSPKIAEGLTHKFSKLWVAAEIVLFVLVGTTLDPSYLQGMGFKVVGLILLVLLIRMIGVGISLIKSNLLLKERAFCFFSYIPKATVQAAIGAIPLTLRLPCGKIVLTVSIASIIITAPLGAFFIELFYKRLLTKDDE